MPIYLDHNATALPLPEAAAAAAEWLGRPANPSSIHGSGRRARAAVEAARRQVAASLGGAPAGVVFTSGATEALHLGLRLAPRGGHVVVSAVEHPAVFGACRARGVDVSVVPVDAAGRLRVADVAAAVEPDTALVVVMRAQNELGNLYPVGEIARAVAPVPVLCDAVQAWGKVPLEVSTLGAALVAVSGHKIGAPPGVGALYVQPGLALDPLLFGGPQERGRRAGTENVAGIVGLGVAASRVADRLAAMPAVAARRDRLRAVFAEAVPGFVVHGEPGLPNTLACRVEGLEGDLLLAALDLAGVELSSGAACSAGGVEPSPVLRALGLDEGAARRGLRLSLGPETTDAEVAQVAEVFPRVALRALAARGQGGARCA